MPIKEEYAIRKWCPFARVVFALASQEAAQDGDLIPAVLANPCNRIVLTLDDDRDPREAAGMEAFNCIGSRCMAWVTQGATGSGSCGMVKGY